MNSYYQSLNVDGRFYLREKLGYGSFGEIHIAEDKITKKRVAVKVEVCLVSFGSFDGSSKILFSNEDFSFLKTSIF